jgi:pimeloyl-ACP methyl ester carboxylesterase
MAAMTSHPQPSRRDVLRAGGCMAGVVATMDLQAQTMNSKVFVLVHPAWHGAWFWKKVVPLLREKGHVVSTPTLTGLVGERSHLARPEISLETHVSDVLNVLKYEDLRDVILVGHSSSGVVITGVADRGPSESRTSSIWTRLCPTTVKPCSTSSHPTDAKRWRSW